MFVSLVVCDVYAVAYTEGGFGGSHFSEQKLLPGIMLMHEKL